MAKFARIDDVIQHADRRVEVRYTEGDGPLPATWGGLALVFPDRESVVAALDFIEEVSAANLKMLQIAVGYKADPTLGATFRSRVVGKEARLDLANPSPAVMSAARIG